MAKRLICDPHHHLWCPDTHTWLDDKEWQKVLKLVIEGVGRARMMNIVYISQLN